MNERKTGSIRYQQEPPEAKKERKVMEKLELTAWLLHAHTLSFADEFPELSEVKRTLRRASPRARHSADSPAPVS